MTGFQEEKHVDIDFIYGFMKRNSKTCYCWCNNKFTFVNLSGELGQWRKYVALSTYPHDEPIVHFRINT